MKIITKGVCVCVCVCDKCNAKEGGGHMNVTIVQASKCLQFHATGSR